MNDYICLTKLKILAMHIFFCWQGDKQDDYIYRPAFFHFPMFASTTEIVLNNNGTFAEFNRKKIFNKNILF